VTAAFAKIVHDIIVADSERLRDIKITFDAQRKRKRKCQTQM